MEKRPLTVRVARWSAEHPWRAIGLWLVFVALSITMGNISGTKEATTHGEVGETARAEKILEDSGFPDEPSVERVLVTSRSGALDQAEATAALADAATRMKALSQVSKVEGPIPAPDGKAMILAVTMTGDPETSYERVQPLLDVTKAVQRDHSAVRVEQAGSASVEKTIEQSFEDDFANAEVLSVVVTLSILILAFGALIAAGVPVLLALSAVAAAIGLSALTSHLVPAQDASSSVVLLIGMAVGVDYSLFYLRREREERAKGHNRPHLDAVEIAAATSGHAVVVSGVAVMISMAGMFLANDAIFSSFAAGSILVVAVSVLGSLTVLPAMLAKLGRWVDRPRVPLLWRLTGARTTAAGQQAEPRVWSFILRPALRHPIVTLLVSGGALIALAAPTLGLSLKFPATTEYARDTPVMQAYGRMIKAFPSTGTEHVIVVKAPASQAGAVKSALEDLSRRAGGDQLFANDQQPVITVSPNNQVTKLTLATPYASSTKEAKQSLERLREDLIPATVGTVSGTEHAVTGEIAGTVDYSDHVKDKLPIVMGFVLLLTFCVMAWTFRSVVVAVTAIGLNMLSVGAAYGLLTAVFQNSWAEGLLNFRSNGGITSWVPLFLFVVLFGLSMDYHVFVVSRIREAIVGGMPNREAVAYGITRSAGVVTSAAIIMVGVFAIFGTLSAPDMKQLGVGLASAILIDATIIRAVVLPSLMTLLGNANWWAPRFLRNRSQTFGAPQERVDQAEQPAERELMPVG